MYTWEEEDEDEDEEESQPSSSTCVGAGWPQRLPWPGLANSSLRNCKLESQEVHEA